MFNIIKKCCLTFLLLSLGMSGCGYGRKKSRAIFPPEFSDPFLQSLRESKAKYVLSQWIGSDLPPDTIFLDSIGNVVRTTGFQRIRREYNLDNFLTRWKVSSDFSVQYVARYSVRGDTLIQSVREMGSSDWDSKNDTATRAYETNFFILNDEGNVSFAFHDLDGNYGVTYVYTDKRLIYKVTEVDRNDSGEFLPERTAKYVYDDKGKIKEMRLWNIVLDEKIYFFSNGLADSSHITRSGYSRRYSYRYVWQ